MIPRVRRPWSVVLALLIGALVAAWRPAVAATAFVVDAPSPVAEGLAATVAAGTGRIVGPTVAVAPHRLPTAFATFPVHARYWSWHRGHSRRGGRDVEQGLSSAALTGSIPDRHSFATRDACGIRRRCGVVVPGISRGAAAPRAPPSRN